MATISASYIPDYTTSQTTGFVATTVTNGTATAALTLGKFRLFKVIFCGSTAGPNNLSLRFTLGLSTGTTAPVPTTSSPFILNNQENVFEMGSEFDQIRFANLDNAASINYTLLPIVKF